MNGDDHKLQKLVISDKINKKDKGDIILCIRHQNLRKGF